MLVQQKLGTLRLMFVWQHVCRLLLLVTLFSWRPRKVRSKARFIWTLPTQRRVRRSHSCSMETSTEDPCSTTLKPILTVFIAATGWMGCKSRRSNVLSLAWSYFKYLISIYPRLWCRNCVSEWLNIMLVAQMPSMFVSMCVVTARREAFKMVPW